MMEEIGDDIFSKEPTEEEKKLFEATEEEAEENPPTQQELPQTISENVETTLTSQTTEDSSPIMVSVVGAKIEGEGMSAYVSFAIRAETKLSGFPSEKLEITRRYNDFFLSS